MMNLSRADPTALARDLLRCPSVTPAEAGALDLIEGVLKAAGFTVHRVTFAEPGTTNMRTPGATFRPAMTSAAARRSSMRPLVQEPMNTRSMAISVIFSPPLRPM